jgi:hypothetical protein
MLKYKYIGTKEQLEKGGFYTLYNVAEYYHRQLFGASNMLNPKGEIIINITNGNIEYRTPFDFAPVTPTRYFSFIQDLITANLVEKVGG